MPAPSICVALPSIRHCLLLLTASVLLSSAESPPKFLRTPNDQTGVQGGVASFICQATGDPQPKIVWNKKGKRVSNQRFEVVIEFDDGSGSVLRIQPLRTPRDEAIYECVASNSVGETSATTRLTVLREDQLPPGFPTIDMGPQLKVVERTRTATMLCAASGNPDPDISWFKDFLPVNTSNNNGRIKQLRSESFGGTPIRGALQIEQSEESDQGKYECVATNNDGTRYSAPANLYVRELREEIDGVATTRYSVGGLSPYSDYQFRVVAVNNIGRGPPSEAIESKTAEQAPSTAPRQVRGRMLSATTAIIHWDEPEEANGQITGYRVYYTTDPSQHVNQWEKQIVRTSNFLTIPGLTPNKTYYIKVLAFTSVGDGPLSSDLQIIAKTGVPSQPTDFKGEAKSETSILLSWNLPTQTGQDNQIVGYELLYKKGDDKEEKRVSFEPTTTYLLKDLKPFTTYTFQLAARSKHGIGAYTNEISAETPQTQPSAPPQEVKCTSPSSTSILVSWKLPPVELQNGIMTRYTVQYAATEGDDTSLHQVSDIPPEKYHYLLENLEKWTEYRVTVSAHTEAGEGPESLPQLIRTEEDVPSGPPRKVEVEAVNSTSVKVLWRSPVPSRQHGQIRGYQVHYVRMVNGEPGGHPVIKDILIDDAQWEYDDSAEHELILTDLHAETMYSVTVAAYTTKGDGARSKPKLVTTTGAVPEKPRLMVSPTNMGTALLQWHPPTNTYGLLQGYRLRFGRKDVEPLTVIEFSERENHYTTKEIHKGASYTFRLSARNRVGFGEETVKEITTPEDTPAGYPQGIVAQSSTTTTIQVSWQPVALAERNGAVIKYALQYKDINSPRSPSELFITAPESTVTLDGLKADTTYDIKMCAFTSKGPGPYSPSVQFRTQPINQVFAKNFHVRAAMKTSVLLTWEIPENYNPAQPFTILYDNGQSVEVDGKLTQKLITNLQPETQYSFLLTNRGNSAGGLQHRVSTMTAPDILRTKPYLIGKTSSDGMVTVELPAVQTAEKVNFFPLSLLQLLREINRTSRALRFRRQMEPKPYIAAYFRELPNEFTLGDAKMYGDFENKQLLNGQEYVFFVLAVLEISDNVSVSGRFTIGLV
ncbi:receptor-type tyrosine-protein phosphatase delta-like, partial [Sinocyclocheilus rhinocerous]|uniref:receptor-type tyrosine-protein phosphatase delta-like n=1 Tax=Sinocyclocheilus rhinocerous TaxID=307959 RepID=UPI0007B9DA44